LFGGSGDSFPTWQDPCDSEEGAAAANPTIAANCAANGVPAGYTQPGGYGAQVRDPTTVGSNPNVQPETATTQTLGIVYSPSYIDGLDIQLDWWQIELEDAISTLTLQSLADQCYRLGNFCGEIFRRANGE